MYANPSHVARGASMRASALVAIVAMVVPVIAGCVDQSPVEEGPGEQATLAIDPDNVPIPGNATLEEIADGVRLAWQSVEVPFEQNVTIPPNATLTNASATIDADTRVWVNVTAPDTGLERCVPDRRVDWDTNVTGTTSCAAMTAPDALPTNWSLTVESTVQTTADVRFDMLAVEPDGLAGDLNLSALSKAKHAVDDLKRKVQHVTSHDGTELRVETIRPDVNASLPSILISTPRADVDQEQVAQQIDVPSVEPLATELAARGYAVAVADVRGFGGSGGCVDMWGQAEQKDQVELVKWVAEQNWSTGDVGMVGTGYAATTALEAAVQDPEPLKAVAAYAPVANPYRDWHFGGVPNGESMSNPATSLARAAVGAAGLDDPTSRIGSSGNCEAGGVAQANDPRAVYNDFYKPRNLTAKADASTTAVLYAQGTLDHNVKPSMAPGLLDKLSGPTLGMVGPWANGPPTRADQLTLLLGWLDQHVAGRDVGFDASAQTTVSATTDAGVGVTGPSWPPADVEPTRLYPDFDAGTLVQQQTDTTGEIVLDPTGQLGGSAQANASTKIVLERKLEEPTMLAGPPKLPLGATLQGFENAFVLMTIRDVAPDGATETVSFGMVNLAHVDGHAGYRPVQPGQLVEKGLPAQPSQHVFEANHTLEIEIRSATSSDWTLVQPPRPGQLVLHGDATALVLPTVPADRVRELPRTVQP